MTEHDFLRRRIAKVIEHIEATLHETDPKKGLPSQEVAGRCRARLESVLAQLRADIRVDQD